MTHTGETPDVGIEIDELTPCLRRTSTNQLVKTTVERISPTQTDTADWEFDWTTPERNGFQVYALKADGDTRVQGMVAMQADEANKSHTRAYNGVGGHLFAEAVRQSIENGYGGFVYFKAKSGLVDYYQSVLGAELINPRDRIMLIDGNAASRLIKRYFGGD